VGGIAGIITAVNDSTGCAATLNSQALSAAGNPAMGTPPLVWHGGAVMGTKLTGPLTVTPIFWNPAGHPMDPAYVSLISQYWADVAKASGQTNNVYSTATEYSGTDGSIVDKINLGTPINDTSPLPASGCTLEAVDTTLIYADNTGYDACIDDSQVAAETNRVVHQDGLPIDFSHIYLLYTPKHVESCFFAGPTNTNQNACTINHLPSAAYCAYHTQAGNSNIYGLLAYPIYHSPVHFTCGSDARVAGFGGVQSPNGNPDADVEISPSSHEVMEAWTDPDTTSGWFDISGFENGDECAYTYGPVSGTKGAFFNQTMNHHHYLTQEEFSNQSFFASGGGCIQGERFA
jgi:hypothetical protein